MFKIRLVGPCNDFSFCQYICSIINGGPRPLRSGRSTHLGEAIRARGDRLAEARGARSNASSPTSARRLGRCAGARRRTSRRCGCAQHACARSWSACAPSRRTRACSKSAAARTGLIFFFGTTRGVGCDLLSWDYAALFPAWQGRARTIAAAGERLPFADASFDIVLSCDNVVDQAKVPAGNCPASFRAC